MNVLDIPQYNIILCSYIEIINEKMFFIIVHNCHIDISNGRYMYDCV